MNVKHPSASAIFKTRMPAKRHASGQVQQRMRETLRARAPAPQKETPPVFVVTDHAGIKQSYETHGFVVIQVLTEAECHKAILEFWNEVINKQLWAEKIQVKSLRTARSTRSFRPTWRSSSRP